MIKISCTIGTTDASVPLGLEIWLDKEQIFNSDHINNTVLFEHSLARINGDYRLQFIMKNKAAEHTKVDNNGVIIKDACLLISDLCIDDFEIFESFHNATYTHNFNGAGPETTEKFYSEMGCNGTVTIHFSVPVYEWLVKNYS